MAKKEYRKREYPHGLVGAVAERLSMNVSYTTKVLAAVEGGRGVLAAKARAVALCAREIMAEEPLLTPSQAVRKAIKTLRLRV